MKKAVQLYNKFEEYILVGSLLFSVLLLFLQIIMRSVFNNSLSWSEELARYIFIWQIWLGTSITYREDKHIKVELIYSLCKTQRMRDIVDSIANSILLAFCGVLFYIGSELAASLFLKNALSPAMRIPLGVVYLSLPFSLLFLSFRIIGRLTTLIKRILSSCHLEANN